MSGNWYWSWRLWGMKSKTGPSEFLSTHCVQANWTSEPAILWNARANDVIDSHICRVDNTINQGKLILPFPLIAALKFLPNYQLAVQSSVQTDLTNWGPLGLVQSSNIVRPIPINKEKLNPYLLLDCSFYPNTIEVPVKQYLNTWDAMKLILK